MKKIITALVLACAVLSQSRASIADIDAQPAVKSLYERLGGEGAIQAVVDDFVARAAANPAVNFARQGQPRTWEASEANVAKLKKHLVQFLCVATGSTAHIYEGADMQTTHANMKITDAEFNALAGDLKTSLEKFSVPQKEIDELLAIAGSTRSAIVEQTPLA